MRVVTLSIISILGCSSNPSTTAPDGGGGGTDASPDAVSSGGCVGVNLAEGDIATRAARLIAVFHAAGETHAGAAINVDSIAINGISPVIGTNVPNPGAAALQWLAGLAPDLFALDELTIPNPPDYSERSFASVRVARSSVRGHSTAFADEAFGLLLGRSPAGTWRINNITIVPHVLWATVAEVEALAACSTTMPGDAGVRTHTFRGFYSGCIPDGAYEYVPRPADHTSIAAPPRWAALDATGGRDGELVRWHVSWPGQLIIDPTSYPYFPDIERSDCWCNDRASFDLEVDGQSGGVIRASPSPACVAC